MPSNNFRQNAEEIQEICTRHYDLLVTTAELTSELSEMGIVLESNEGDVYSLRDSEIQSGEELSHGYIALLDVVIN